MLLCSICQGDTDFLWFLYVEVFKLTSVVYRACMLRSYQGDIDYLCCLYVEVIKVNGSGVLIWGKLPRWHELFLLLIGSSYQDCMDDAFCLYVEVVKVTWLTCGAYIEKLSRGHGLWRFMVLTWRMYQGDSEYGNVKRLYVVDVVEVIKMTWIICCVCMWKLSRWQWLCMMPSRKSYPDGMDYDIVLCLYVEVLKVI